MPLPFLLSALPGLFQVGSGLYQANQASKVRTQDTRTDSFREALALDRQRANSQRFAGQSNAENRINQGAANAINTAMQSGTGASGVLAAATRINQNQNNAFNQLADRAQAVQQGNQDRLRSTLQQDAAWQARDREAAQRERAALTQGAAQNLFGGLSTLGTVGAYASQGGFNRVPEQLPVDTPMQTSTPILGNWQQNGAPNQLDYYNRPRNPNVLFNPFERLQPFRY